MMVGLPQGSSEFQLAVPIPLQEGVSTDHGPDAAETDGGIEDFRSGFQAVLNDFSLGEGESGTEGTGTDETEEQDEEAESRAILGADMASLLLAGYWPAVEQRVPVEESAAAPASPAGESHAGTSRPPERSAASSSSLIDGIQDVLPVSAGVEGTRTASGPQEPQVTFQQVEISETSVLNATQPVSAGDSPKAESGEVTGRQEVLNESRARSVAPAGSSAQRMAFSGGVVRTHISSTPNAHSLRADSETPLLQSITQGDQPATSTGVATSQALADKGVKSGSLAFAAEIGSEPIARQHSLSAGTLNRVPDRIGAEANAGSEHSSKVTGAEVRQDAADPQFSSPEQDAREHRSGVAETTGEERNSPEPAGFPGKEDQKPFHSGPSHVSIGSGAKQEATGFKSRPATEPAAFEGTGGPTSANVGQKTVTGMRLRVNGPQRDSGVDVQVIERAGRLQVAVRTDDADLQSVLREDVGQLVARVEEHGLRTEVWAPSGSGAQFGQGGQTGHETGSRFGESPPGGQSGQGDRDRQQGDERSGRPAWLDQLEESFSSKATDTKEEREWVRILRR
jgi:hypothetical protein